MRAFLGGSLLPASSSTPYPTNTPAHAHNHHSTNSYAAAQAGKASSRPFRAIYVDGSLESTDVAAIGEIAAQLEVG